MLKNIKKKQQGEKWTFNTSCEAGFYGRHQKQTNTEDIIKSKLAWWKGTQKFKIRKIKCFKNIS